MSNWKTHQVCLVLGSYDSRKGKETGYGLITLGELVELKPTKLEKPKANAIIPSSYCEADARSHAKQREHGLFVVLVGDIDSGNHSLEEIDDLLADALGEEVAGFIYSTSSATVENRKWRFMIPLAEPQPHSLWEAMMHGLYAFMETKGVKLDRALLGPGQLCYLPNVAPENQAAGFYQCKLVDGAGATPESGQLPASIARWQQEEGAREAAKEETRASVAAARALKPSRGDPSIEAFNRANSLAELLASYGYTQSPHNHDDWQSRYQGSGSYATRIYRDKDGDEGWVSLSGSDAEKAIGAAGDGCCWGDAFDLKVHYVHGGDFTAAVNSLTDNIPPQLAEAIARLEPTDAYPDPVEQEKAIRGAYAGGGGDDIANGEVFAVMYRGCLLHIPETDEILRHDTEAGWLNTVASKTTIVAAKSVVQKIARDAGRVHDDDLRGKLLNRALRAGSNINRLTAMAKLGFAEPGMWASLREFDADPSLLGVKNGILRLDTLELMKPSPGVLVSKRVNVSFDSSAGCPVFEAFLARVQPDLEVRRLLQQLAGIWLYGEPLIQRFIFMHGHGANGKSTFMETMAFLLGDYVAAIPTEMLMQKRRDAGQATPDLMMLKGARLAYCNETGEGRRLDAAVVKQLTGGDTITARPLHGDFISFRPSHSLVMTGNHKPFIDETGDGLWRRLLLIDWPVTIPEHQRDEALPARLRDEAAGIANWALTGLRDFMQTHQLSIPASVCDATASYRSEQDILGAWFDEGLIRDDDEQVDTQSVYDDYRRWCAENGFSPITKSSLTRRLEERGILRGGQGRRFYRGIRMLSGMGVPGAAAQ